MFFLVARRTMSVSKKSRRPIISGPTNFEHRVHTGHDPIHGNFVGLPKQWASVVESSSANNQRTSDPSVITPIKVQDCHIILIKTISYLGYSLDLTRLRTYTFCISVYYVL